VEHEKQMLEDNDKTFIYTPSTEQAPLDDNDDDETFIYTPSTRQASLDDNDDDETFHYDLSSCQLNGTATWDLTNHFPLPSSSQSGRTDNASVMVDNDETFIYTPLTGQASLDDNDDNETFHYDLSSCQLNGTAAQDLTNHFPLPSSSQSGRTDNASVIVRP
jgi:hypothetical protein